MQHKNKQNEQWIILLCSYTDCRLFVNNHFVFIGSYWLVQSYIFKTNILTISSRSRIYQTSNDNIVKALKNRQDFLSAMIRNHTSIIDNTISLVQKQESEIQAQFELFNKHLAKIDFYRNWDHLAVDIHDHLHSLSTYSTLIFTRFRNTQLYTIDTLTSVHSSGLQLLTPTLLHSELLKIEPYITNNLHIPKTNNKLDAKVIPDSCSIKHTMPGDYWIQMLGFKQIHFLYSRTSHSRFNLFSINTKLHLRKFWYPKNTIKMSATNQKPHT